MRANTIAATILLAATAALSQVTDTDAIRKAAEHGNADAQYKFAYAYDQEHVTPEGHSEALVWYRKAADQGVPAAQSMLGFCYEIGYGLPQDSTQAAIWFRKAADQGLAFAEAHLGYAYGVGKGVPQNFEVAASWYRKASDQGDSFGQALLGSAYLAGQGIERNYTEAYFWLNLALAGDIDGLKSVREATEKAKQEAGRHLTTEQIKEIQNRSMTWFEKNENAKPQ